jgi:nucleoside-diphosphate-sugar epimerase
MADRLLAGGYRVRALVRTPQQADAVSARGLMPVRGDLTEPGSLREAVDGVSVVVHSAAHLGREDRELAERVNTAGSRALAEASLHAGVERFVHISTVSVYGDPLPDGPLDEDTPLQPDDQEVYVATKSRAEIELRALAMRGLPVVVLRPGAICAVTGSQWGDEMIGRMRDDGWHNKWHPDDIIPWTHTDDLAEMAWLAATHPAAAGQTFNAVDRNVTAADYILRVAEALGLPVTPPDREPQTGTCRIGKIRDVLGYSPARAFEQTLEGLLMLAADQGVGGGQPAALFLLFRV